MPEIDWIMLVLGLLGGLAAVALFFGGLALGMRLALRRARPMVVLLPSAAIRIALLLVAVWWVAGQGGAALAGFVIAFLVARFVLLSRMRSTTLKGAV